jgi:hypothetical protein
MTSALALLTPDATTPMPASATSFTDTYEWQSSRDTQHMLAIVAPGPIGCSVNQLCHYMQAMGEATGKPTETLTDSACSSS